MSIARWVVGVLVAAILSAPALAQPRKVEISAVASRTDVLPGDQVAVAVVFRHEDGWHIHTNSPVIPKSWGDFPAIATTIVVTPSPGITAGAPQWPKPSEIRLDLGATGTPEPYLVFEGEAIAFVPLLIDTGAQPGPRVVKIAATYQACDDSVCLLRQTDELEVEMNVLAAGSARGPENQPALFATLDRGIFARVGQAAAPGDAKPVTFNVFGWTFDLGGTGLAFLIPMLLLAALGGFVLNFTPCVLPVIPIKIMGLSAVAGNRGRLLVLGASSSLGTISFWIGIGVAMATISSFRAINQLFQCPWFGIGVGAFIAIMGLGMMGLFTVRLPQAVYAVEADKGSVGGSFLFGVMTAVLSTPCTAPFMAAASAWAATQPAGRTLSVFTAIGVGMAVPYFVLAAFPALIERVPRTGPASELVKQTMGALMLAIAVFFAGTGLDPLLREAVDPPIRLHWWITAAIVCVAMGWLAYRTFRITTSAAKRGFFAVASAVLAALMILVAVRVTDRGPISWVAYTPERFEEARAAHKVVVLDFTAEWCLNCKALEAGVLHRPSVVSLLNGPGVVPMRVDLTGENRPGQDLLQKLNWVGIPLLSIWGPGLSEPLNYDTYTPDTVVKAVDRAKGAP